MFWNALLLITWKPLQNFRLNVRMVTREKQLTVHSYGQVSSVPISFQGPGPQCKKTISPSGYNMEWVNHCSEKYRLREICSTSACYRWYGCGPCQKSLHNYQQALNSHIPSQYDPLHTCNILADSYKSTSVFLFSCHV